MDTWVPIVLVALAVVAIVVVLTMRAARSRGAPRDDDDDAARREGADAYYRSQRDQTDYAPGAANTRNPRKTTP